MMHWLALGCTSSPPSEGTRDSTASSASDSAPSTGSAVDFVVTVEDTTYGLTLTGPPTLADREGLSLLAVEATSTDAEIALGVYDDEPLLPGDHLLGVWGGPAEQTRITLVVLDGVTVHTYRTSDTGLSDGVLTITGLDREDGEVALVFAGELDHTVNGGPIDGTAPATGTLYTTSFAFER